MLESTASDSPYLKLIHDSYTNVVGLDLIYYCYPYAFNVLNYDDDDIAEGAVHSYCELPFSCFDEIVDGAVKMYIQEYKFALQLNNNNRRARRRRENADEED